MERWYLLFSKPRKEDQVRGELERKGLTVYLPMLPQRVGASRRGAATRMRPLFPRYLFARVDAERVGLDVVRWTPGLSDLVSFEGELAVVDDSVIAYMQERTRHLQAQQEQPLSPGQHVRLRPGHPLAALDAVFQRSLSGGARARILVEVLGRLTHCEVNLEDLEPVSTSS